MRPAEKNEHERVQFGLLPNTGGGLTRTLHGKKHTEHKSVQFWGTTQLERVPYTHVKRCTQRYISTYTH